MTPTPVLPDDWPAVTIPASHWEETTDGVEPRSRLLANIVINGLPLHVEAWAVELVDGLQESLTAFPDDLDHLDNIAGPDKPFMTTKIEGQEYVLVAYPHC